MLLFQYAKNTLKEPPNVAGFGKEPRPEDLFSHCSATLFSRMVTFWHLLKIRYFECHILYRLWIKWLQ